MRSRDIGRDSCPGVFADEEAIETFHQLPVALVPEMVREYSLTKKRLRHDSRLAGLQNIHIVREYSLTKKRLRLREAVSHSPPPHCPGVFADEEAIETCPVVAKGRMEQ